MSLLSWAKSLVTLSVPSRGAARAARRRQRRIAAPWRGANYRSRPYREAKAWRQSVAWFWRCVADAARLQRLRGPRAAA